MASSSSSGIQDIAQSLSEVAKAYRLAQDNAKELEYAVKSLELFQKQAFDSQEYADLLKILGCAYGYNGDCKKELEYKLKALRMYDRLNLKEESFISGCSTEIAVAKRAKSDNKAELALRLKALEMHRRLYLGDNKRIAYSLCRVGNSYISVGDLKKGFEYNLKAWQMYQTLNINETNLKDLKDMAYCLESVGNLFIYLKRELNFSLTDLTES